MTRRVVPDQVVAPGDLVLVSKGNPFYARVLGRGVGGFQIAPLDPKVRHRRAVGSELLDHWAHTDVRALQARRGQLTLDDLV